MQTNKTRQDRLRKWLDLKQEERKQRLARRDGISIGKAVGGSLMSGGSVAPNDSPDGSPVESDGDKAKLTEKLEYGDEIENLELYDCETGEKVTLDGFGGNGAEPKYPIGFEDCKAEKKPTMEELDGAVIFVTRYQHSLINPPTNELYYELSDAKFQSLKPRAMQAAAGAVGSGCSVSVFSDTTSSYKVEAPQNYPGIPCRRRTEYGSWAGVTYRTSTTTADKQAYIDNFVAPIWSENDKNHLTLNDDGCFGTLCPEHNNQVSPKYQGCQDEMILCDENGKKNKVTVNDDGSVDILQGDFNQVSTVKNGKVISVKKLTESQKERAMNAS